MTFDVRSRRAHQLLDTSGDGKLGPGELADDAIARMDTNGDGGVDVDELDVAMGGVNDPQRTEGTPQEVAAGRVVRTRDNLLRHADVDAPMVFAHENEQAAEATRGKIGTYGLLGSVVGGGGTALVAELLGASAATGGVVFVVLIALTSLAWLAAPLFASDDRPDPAAAGREHRAAIEELARTLPPRAPTQRDALEAPRTPRR